ADPFGIQEPFPANIYPIEGTETEVTCVAFDTSGNKTPERIQFMRKDNFARYANITASENIKFTQRTEDAEPPASEKLFVTMTIKNVTLNDDSSYGLLGRYECHAFAKGDPLERKHGFSVNVISRDEIPSVKVPQISVLRQGESTTFSCNLTRNPGKGSILKRISWYKDGILLESIRNPDPNKPLDTLRPLVLKNIGVRDGGNYTCFLEVALRNIRMYNVSDSTTVEIAAWLNKYKEDPEFKKFKGDSVSFECPAKGNPLRVEWKVKKKGEDAITPCINGSDGKYRIHREGIYEPYFLTVTDLQYSDRGSYYCCLPSNCSNSVEGDCQRFVLRVRDPLGPLWPVIGIIIEAIVLFLIIFIAEKRKKKREGGEEKNHFDSNSPFFVSYFFRQDGRVEFSFSSTDDGDRGQVRLRKVNESTVA
ncbi:unnamed protein product, partial [Porites evermanni]